MAIVKGFKSTRDAYGEILVELGEIKKDLFVMDADLSMSTRTCLFAKRYPERFFNAGVAEQNMIGIASGLSKTGKTVVVSTLAVFSPGRCFDQIRNTLGNDAGFAAPRASHNQNWTLNCFNRLSLCRIEILEIIHKIYL